MLYSRQLRRSALQSAGLLLRILLPGQIDFLRHSMQYRNGRNAKAIGEARFLATLPQLPPIVHSVRIPAEPL